MATPARPRHIIAPQLEIGVYRRSAEKPIRARLELAQARELIGRLSLVDPQDSDITNAMKGNDPSRLLLGLQAFYRRVLQQDGCVAVAAVDGSLWTVPARAVEAVEVRLVTGVARPANGAGAATTRLPVEQAATGTEQA